MAAIHHTITAIMLLEFGRAQITDLSFWNCWQPIPCAWVGGTEAHLSTFWEVLANINAPTMIPQHVPRPAGDTSGLHTHY